MSKNSKKIDVLIVGAFKHKKDGGTGGVLFACKSLTESSLTDKINWIKLDSTGGIPPPNVVFRALRAAKRVLLFLFFLISRPNIQSIILFSSNGGSFIEKGLMCLIANKWGKKVLFAPRSGNLLSDFKNKIFKSFGKHILKKADIILCQGQTWKDYYYNLCDGDCNSDKFVVVANWINSSEYQKKGELENNKKEIIYLFLGWTIREKGLFDIIEAVKILMHKGLIFKVVIAGDGVDKAEAETLINDLNLDKYINLLGWVQGERKRELLKEADVFILPSYFEGFPNSVLEAMASGLPVITTDVGAVRELVDESTGIIVPIGDINKISDAMENYGKNDYLREVHGANGYARVRNNFDIESVVAKFEKLLL